MRSWIWYKTTGEIGGEERMAPGGWPLSIDFNDPAIPDAAVQRLRALRAAEPGFAAFLPYDCACPVDHGVCSCVCKIAATHKVVAGSLVAKTGYSIILDGVVVDGVTTIDKEPTSDLTLHLEGPLPDGAKIDLVEPPGTQLSVLPAGPNVLTFNNGETNVIAFVAPPRLNIVRLALRPQDARDSAVRGLRIRGW